MEDKEFLHSISILKNIQPRANWVLFVKNRLFEEQNLQKKQSQFHSIFEAFSLLRYLEKPAFVIPALALIVSSGIAFRVTADSLPGDALYPMKSAFERVSLTFVPEDIKSLAQLELAQKRLDDIKKIAGANKGQNLSETIKEFNMNVAEVSKEYSQLVEKREGKALQLASKLVQLQKDKAAVEQIFGVMIGPEEEQELQNTTKMLVENELTDLLERTLTGEQKSLLDEAIVAYQQEDYEKALERIWSISN